MRKFIQIKTLAFLLGIVATSSFAYHTFWVKNIQLEKEYRARLKQYQTLKEEQYSLSTEIHMLKVEIQALKTDSEESSLAARTLLGMVRPTEFVYQLNTKTQGE